MDEVSAGFAASGLKGALAFQSSMAAAIIQSGAQTVNSGGGADAGGLRVAAMQEQGVGRQVDVTV